MTWQWISPAISRNAVEGRAGRVIASESIAEGLSCTTALALTTERSGRLFFKGAREADAEAVAALDWEARVNETVLGVSPAIRHRFRGGGWSCLAFAYIEGRHADLSPGTKDLAAVTSALRRMQGLSNPALPTPRLADRFARYLLPGEAEHLSGPALLHTDTNPHNIMVSRKGTAYVVDWARAATGPAWLDPAWTAVRLMECGRAPADALAWLDGFASWRHADSRSVETFVNVTCRWWTTVVGEQAARRSNARFRYLLGERAEISPSGV
ncbi:phosphotransferase [Streptomyces sp. I05A-00742]|uniref:phosphotransferase n=1 Tax=Streptomyces sp. I05A-00742 TaxID=2732853 RepID=UPI0014882805|nr:phosphotransferase [Streptomyces sp. I05A-00742]